MANADYYFDKAADNDNSLDQTVYYSARAIGELLEEIRDELKEANRQLSQLSE